MIEEIFIYMSFKSYKKNDYEHGLRFSNQLALIICFISQYKWVQPNEHNITQHVMLVIMRALGYNNQMLGNLDKEVQI